MLTRPRTETVPGLPAAPAGSRSWARARPWGGATSSLTTPGSPRDLVPDDPTLAGLAVGCPSVEAATAPRSTLTW